MNACTIAVGWVLAPRLLSKCVTRWEAADLIASTPVFVVLAALAFIGTAELGDTVQLARPRSLHVSRFARCW